MVVVVWILALLFMEVKVISQLGRLQSSVLAGITVVLLGISWFYANPSSDKPTDSHLFYMMDQDKQQAKWVSTRPPDVVKAICRIRFNVISQKYSPFQL